MNSVKVPKYVSRSSAVENASAKPQKKEGRESELAPSKDSRNQTDKWFIGFNAKESINVPRNAVPKQLLDVLKKPALTSIKSDKTEYDRSQFLLTGLHSGDESRVEIALIAEGGGGGFADVMPDKNGYVITVPELFEFEGKSFTGDEFLQAVNAAKAQFQRRGTPITTNTFDDGAEKS